LKKWHENRKLQITVRVSAIRERMEGQRQGVSYTRESGASRNQVYAMVRVVYL